ncbi:hypothetical protein ACFW3D_03950 [Streptomyces sp. NPDC058864]
MSAAAVPSAGLVRAPAARRASGADYGGFVTAGHCAHPAPAVHGWDGSCVGAFPGGTFPGNDHGRVNLGSGRRTVPVVLGRGTVPDTLARCGLTVHTA